ncbi:MAG: D-glycero-beta-D-manno-heptose-7-phosphate kinase [Leptospiraceae bacterium]|nr:D-glycero-beta-D-manno-heptose-7-phosphate kinase [Leptospiraceae bacterium]MDW7975416.1 D-glycero-beta-D-manno-heptose-7-phosphate kinase [Leptospiraceae bacterium]
MMSLNNQKTKQIIEKFKDIKILVVGDFMLDEYIFGKAERISPEAPVPIVEETHRKHIPGGAGNVFCNLKSLHITTYCAGTYGKDLEGEILLQKMKEFQLHSEENLLIPISKPTTRKSRIIATHQQICRLDREDRTPISKEILDELLKKITSIASKIDGIIISDYDKGVIVRELIEELVILGKRHQIPIAVDPQIGHFSSYQEVFIVTPNHIEAGRFLNRKIYNDQEIEQGGKEILEKLNCENVLITRGEKGMTLITKYETYHIPSVAKEVYDVTGAGDTVISVLMASYCASKDLLYSTFLSNHAAGIVVGRLGAATVKPEELLI